MISSIIGWVIGPLGALVGSVLAMMAAFLLGGRRARKNEELKALQRYKEQQDALEQVKRGDDPAAARERLLRSGKS